MKFSIPEALSGNRHHLDEQETHIEINQELARQTGAAEVLIACCPAEVYSLDAEGTILVEYAACLECGTCLAVAPPGTLKWHYPRGSMGIEFRRG